MTMTRLPGFELVTYTGYVESPRPPLDTSASPRWVQTFDGRQWLLKREEDSAPEELIGEALGLFFGRELGARIPEAALFRDGARRGWLSHSVSPADVWSPETRDLVANPAEVAAMIVLDAVLANQDRHAENVLVTPAVRGPGRVVWAIDHGAVIATDATRLLALGSTPPVPHANTPRFAFAALAARVEATAARLEQMPETSILGLIDQAWAVGGRKVGPDHAARIRERCKVATVIADGYLHALGALP